MRPISIITPSLNRAAYIGEAIESVLRQGQAAFEHIVVDGASTDETLEILKSYEHLRVLSEPDRGLYDAINKGIGLATGEIIGLLNTDDHYETNIFEIVRRKFEENPDVTALVGGSTIFRENRFGEREVLAAFSAIPRRDLLTQVSTGLPPFNGWFFRKEIFSKIGNFDIRYQYSADRDFLIRMALSREKFIYVDKILYHYRQHPGSLTFNPSGDAESKFFIENRCLAEDYLSKNDLHPKVRRRILAWHSQLITDQVLFAISQVDLIRAAEYASRGLKFNTGWLWIFIKNIPLSAGRVFTRNAKRLTPHIFGFFVARHK